MLKHFMLNERRTTIRVIRSLVQVIRLKRPLNSKQVLISE